MLEPGRRGLLTFAANVLAWMASRQRLSAASVGLREFLELSSRLTGRRDLDPNLGRIYFNALVGVAKNRQLLDEVARREKSHPELESQIILAWYTGVYEAAGQRRLATHRGALLWKALDMPAPGTCAGQPGFWSRPPEERL
ncbi:MAG TPA: sugar dehydrogenase complex small subunit [Bryobacteraceae bacterium]|nr:sugar dehydrogenase complex small subunit [Bryobacteraceae bacterium]